MEDALGQMQNKMEKDMSSLKEQHIEKLQALHDQIARRSEDRT